MFSTTSNNSPRVTMSSTEDTKTPVENIAKSNHKLTFINPRDSRSFEKGPTKDHDKEIAKVDAKVGFSTM